MHKTLVIVFTWLVLTSFTTCLVPSDVFDISNWYLTLPIGQYKSPINIYQPTLNNFSQEPYFVAVKHGNDSGIQFRATISKDSVTTIGSNYPRSELREMDPTDPTKTKIAWNNKVGVHTMTMDLAVTHLPTKQPSVTAGQIHDATKFILTIRIAGSKLYTNFDGTTTTITTNFKLGQRYKMKIESYSGTTKVYYNDMQHAAVVKNNYYFSGAYFKAGAYAASNCDVEGDLCDKSDNYAEVVIYNLTTLHDYSTNYPQVGNETRSGAGVMRCWEMACLLIVGLLFIGL